VPFDLDPVEARVLGCLIEKEMSTPDYYPLSLNALVNACNQKSSREPVMAVNDDDVAAALDKLNFRGMSLTFTGGSRVAKYGHRLVERLGLGNRELALIACLLLRGPQTLGELRQRTQSMHDFEDMDTVESVLKKMADRDEPLTQPLGNRWAHLLQGEVSEAAVVSGSARLQAVGGNEKILELEARIADLERRFADLERQLN
jgi:uncharacterized protein YceH (UPF0502 family)